MNKVSWYIAGFLSALSLTVVASGGFTDENKFADWNRDAINRIQNMGIINGYKDGRFGPNDYVTRAELAVILDRTLRMQNGEEIIEKTDEDMEKENITMMDDDAIKGDVNAPITIIEFSDYQCPYCGRYVSETYGKIKENYIDTGKVRYVFRDFPLGFHTNAKRAAMASECVREQGGDDAFWEYHDTLFENQNELSADKLKEYASGMGYEIASCLDTEKYANEVDSDTKEGVSFGVSGTPTFFINGKKLVGAQPYSAFESVIEAALK